MIGVDQVDGPTVVAGLRADTIDVAALVDRVRREDCGGLVVFEGTTRTPNHGHRVLALDYEAWEDRTPAQLERIFDRFYRADASRTRSDEGAGLGLAITRSIIEAHRGHIRAESSQQRTRFIVQLPVS